MSQHPMLSFNSYPMIDNLPLHWDLLNKKDLDEYVKLRTNLYASINKIKKCGRIESFISQIKAIRSFVERGDEDDWKRGVVCGIIFLDNAIAIHIQQLRLLLGKCKSSINGSLQQIGFTAHPQGSPVSEELIQKVPIFQKQHSEVKKWTIRDPNGKMDLLLGERQTKKEPEKPKIDAFSVYNVPIKFRMKFSKLYQPSQLIKG